LRADSKARANTGAGGGGGEIRSSARRTPLRRRYRGERERGREGGREGERERETSLFIDSPNNRNNYPARDERRRASRRPPRDTGNFRLAAVTPHHHRHHHRGAIPVTLIIEIAVGVPSNRPPSPSSVLLPLRLPLLLLLLLLLQSPRSRSQTSLEYSVSSFSSFSSFSPYRISVALSLILPRVDILPLDSAASFSSSRQVPRANFAEEQPRDCAPLNIQSLRPRLALVLHEAPETRVRINRQVDFTGRAMFRMFPFAFFPLAGVFLIR